MNKSALALSVAAVLAILISANTHSWRKGHLPLELSVEVPVRVGLLGMEVCAPTVLGVTVAKSCERVGFEQTTDGAHLPPQKLIFVVASRLAYGLSLAAAALLVGAVLVSTSGGWLRPAKVAGMASAAYALASVAAVASWTGADVPIAWGFWLALLGGVLGAVASGALLMPAAEETGGELAPSLRARLDAPPARAGGSPPGAQTGSPASTASGFGWDPLRNSLDTVAHTTGVDATAAMLRFCAREVELRDRGMTVTGHDDSVRFVEYGNLAGVVVRALPPDPPFDGRLMVDLVPLPDARERRAPVRLLPNTRVNYSALPGGAASTSMDNLRRLTDFVVCTQPNIVRDPDLTAFLAGRPPRRFGSMKEFSAYDAGFAPR